MPRNTREISFSDFGLDDMQADQATPEVICMLHEELIEEGENVSLEETAELARSHPHGW